MAVVKGNRVKVHYRGTLDDGSEFDSSYVREEPLEFVVGSGQLISGFDNGVIGMNQGEKKTVVITSDEAYGVRREELVREYSKSNFPPDFEFELGTPVQTSTENGPLFAIISSVKDEVIDVDFNHPLAGQNLTFDIELISFEESILENQQD